jgi:nucleotide-binding universal stress UspA family protein
MTGINDEIIVGYDGSPGSELALHWAAREARERGTRLTVCHAWAPEDRMLPVEPLVFDLTRQQGEEIMNQGLHQLTGALGLLTRAAPW